MATGVIREAVFMLSHTRVGRSAVMSTHTQAETERTPPAASVNDFTLWLAALQGEMERHETEERDERQTPCMCH